MNLMSDVTTIGERNATTTSSGFTWVAREIRYEREGSLSEQLAEATPDNSVLLDWAAGVSNQPPQEWWDSTDDPFAPLDE